MIIFVYQMKMGLRPARSVPLAKGYFFARLVRNLSNLIFAK